MNDAAPPSVPGSVPGLADLSSVLASQEEAHDKASLDYSQNPSKETLKNFIGASTCFREGLSNAISLISSLEGNSDVNEADDAGAIERSGLESAEDYATQLLFATMKVFLTTYPKVELPVPDTPHYQARYEQIRTKIQEVRSKADVSTSDWDDSRVDKMAFTFVIIGISQDLLETKFLPILYNAAKEYDLETQKAPADEAESSEKSTRTV